MKVTITHKHILDAIKFNNLVAGAWFERKDFDDPHDLVYKANCSACLVGSTVRRAAPKKIDLDALDELISVNTSSEICGSEKSPELLVEECDYLTALSAKFESTIRNKAALKFNLRTCDLDSKHLRKIKLTATEKKQLVQWVKLYIPKSFEIESND